MRGGPYFISIEGGDKAGKTTQARLLVDWLSRQGLDVVLTREPGGTAAGEAIRRLLLGAAETNLTPVSEALLFAASRGQLVAEVIRPALAAGKVVVADRYVDSSLAYQADGLGLPFDRVWAVNEWATGSLWPDLTVLLDDLGAGTERSRGASTDRIEKRQADFHQRVAEGYRRLARDNPGRYAVVDASQSASRVAEAVKMVVRKRLAGEEVPGQ